MANLDDLHDAISAHLASIERFFKPGVKLTLVVRQPEVHPEEGGLVIGNDDIAEAIRELERRKAQEATRPPCANMSPPWFTGRWRDWHRGHGCDRDDGKPRTPEGAAEIERGGRA